MLKIIERLTKSKNPNSKRYKADFARRLHGKRIKYVTERIDNEDIVIGHDGEMSVRGDELIVFSSNNIVLRVKIDELSASELMSLDGVILSGKNLEDGGNERTIIAYYLYYL